LVQEYLTRHALSGLSTDLQDFLIRTSVLRRPTVRLCDELLGWNQGSRELLAELERRQLFTDRLDEDSYRYHTVLLSYLEARLVDAIGVTAAQEEHRRAALLLEREGLTEDAAAAFAKAEDWDGVARTLGYPAGAGAGLGGAWLEALPPTVVETDALLLMARARRALASGALADAVATMKAAEEVAASTLVAERCREERGRIAAWMNAERPAGDDWIALLRGATQRQPREAQRVASLLTGPSGRFAEGVAAFLAGDMLTGARLLRGVAAHPGSASPMAAGAQLMATICASMNGRDPQEDALDRLRDEVEEAGIPWLDRMARAALVLYTPLSTDALDNLGDACQREGDRWGEALVALMSGICHLRRGVVGVPDFERAASMFDELGAGVLATVGYGYLALAAQVAGDRELAARAAQQARSLASLLDVPHAAGLAALALGRLFGDEREFSRARELLNPLGTWEWHQRLGIDPLGEADGGPGRPEQSGSPSGERHSAEDVVTSVNGRVAGTEMPPVATVQLRCLGGFSLAVRGRTVDESAAKPMERALLHLLSMQAGEQVHREALIEALWPEAERDAGLHRLQVAISSLRRLIAVDHEDQPLLLAREGDSYRLIVPEDSDVDLWQLDTHLRRAALARNSGQFLLEEESLAAALAAYGGPLLPGDGPANWVVSRRQALEATVADAAARLAGLRLQNGDLQAAAEAARMGLSLDRFRDDLWKLLIEAADRSGFHAEAGQARRAYAAILDELGV
jgi:DNA-binding SARP family transcriptional activator